MRNFMSFTVHNNFQIKLVNTQNVSVNKIIDSSSIQRAETKYGIRIQFKLPHKSLSNCCFSLSVRFSFCRQPDTSFSHSKSLSPIQKPHGLLYMLMNSFLSSSQMEHRLDATLCRFYFCRVTLHVSGANAQHQEYLNLVQRPLVHVLSLKVSHHISLLGPEALLRRCDD